MAGTANPAEAQPYAPDGIANIGKAPVNGVGGERGTSAFAGNSEYEADGTLKAAVTTPSEGPRRGVDSYSEYGDALVPTGNHANEGPSREAADSYVAPPVP